MSKCKKVQNPCKICLGPVKQKTGLQCQGACESWVHYTCLNYTPGKIKDIQAGVITITCPCPDCKTTVPKEILRDPPFTCNNIMCPANNPPSCDVASCQANEVTAGRPPPVLPPGALIDCGDECKNYLQTVFHSQPSDPCMQGFDVSATNSQTSSLGKPAKSGKPAKPGVNKKKATPACCGLHGCCNLGSGGGGGGLGVGGGGGGGYGMGGGGGGGGGYGYSGGGGGCGMGGGGAGAMMPSISTVQQMCQTVGELTSQLNELMAKMKQSGGTGGTGGDGIYSPNRVNQINQRNCPQSGPKDLCPKPCFCPGNPARRRQ